MQTAQDKHGETEQARFVRMKRLTKSKYRGALCLVVASVCLVALGIDSDSTQRAQSSGRWYMGTATGFDCDLVIGPFHTLTVQYGGCFSHGPLMKSAWSQGSDRVNIADAALRKKLGRYLSIIRYKGNVMLVPESEQAYVAANGYNRAHCFWPNLMENGLEWPKAVSDFDRVARLRRPPTHL